MVRFHGDPQTKRGCLHSYYRFHYYLRFDIICFVAERNRHVPFPELVGKGSSLEGLVIAMAENRFLPYTQLPQTISAAQIETYANWISQLTEQDPKSAERGAVLHVRADNKRIIFPSNPDVGDEGSSGWVISKKRNRFIPIIDVHSHATDVCHSGPRGDLGTLIAGLTEDNFVPAGRLVATPGHNYLMIKSQETEIVDDIWDIYDKIGRVRDHKQANEEFMQFRRFGSSLGRGMQDTSKYWKIYEQAEQQTFVPNGFGSYYDNFINAITIAEIYNLGFYKSKKDGEYVRFTRLQVMEHIKNEFDAALTKAHMKMQFSL